MIKYVKGDVVEAFKKGEIDVLIHGVNCQGKMNSGIAKQIRAEFPEVFDNYSTYCQSIYCSNCSDCCVCGKSNKTSTLLGDVQTVRIGTSFKFVVNAFTQDLYGYVKGTKYCSYDAIDSTMKEIVSQCTGGVRIGMPLIGSKRGGGDWKVIEAIINSHFKDREVFVYELE